MLTTSGNPLNTNNSTNTSNNTNSSTSGNKTNLLSASSLINSDFMLPINNLTNNNPMATTSSYLNDYNKLYRDVGLFQQAAATHQQQASKQQTANLIGNNTLNNLVVNNLTSSLNNLGNHTNLNGLPNHNQQLNNLNNLQQQQSATSVSTSKQQQLINNNNPDFMVYLNRCNQFLELNMFQQALDEINHALSLVNNSTMARFRKAQALLGLKRYFECEKELWTCINLEPNVMDYRKELLKVKQIALMSLNLNHLDQNTILMAAQKYDSIKEAMDALMWSNSMMDFNYSTGNTATGPFQSSAATSNTTNTSNLNETSLMNGWNLHSNQANRFGSTNSTTNQFNQLMNNGNNNLLFNNNLISNNLLLNNTNLINRSNNGTTSNLSTNNLTTNNSQHQQGHNNNTSGLTSVGMSSNLKTVANQQIVAPNSTSASNNLINSSTSSNSSSNNQQQPSNSPLNNSDQNMLTNGLNGLSNGNNRFNYLLRGLDHQSHLLNSNSAAQSTNGQNSSNQNLINNQQQLFNRIMPSFIDNNNVSSALDQQQHQTKNHATSTAVNNQAVLNCSRNLSSKLTLNDNSILNGTNGLLMMNNNNGLNNSAPSPICAKLSSSGSNQPTSVAANNNNANNLNSTNSTSLTNSCNYNIFNQMPEMKLIETIVPNLLGSLGAVNSSLNSSSTHSNHNTDSTLNNSNNNDLTSTNHKLLASLAKEVNSVKDSLVNNLVDNFTNNVQQHHQSMTKQQPESTYDDCNKSTNKKTMGKIDLLSELSGVVDKSMMINNKLDNSGVLDFKSVKEDSLINSLNQQHLKTNDDNQSVASSVANSCGSATSSVTNTSTANHLTSYSDIVKRAKKITQQSLTNSNASTGQANLGGLASNKENTNLTNKTDNESNSDDNSAASKRPTNLWAYNGLRVANVSLTASKSSLMSLFSKFGRIRLLERIINKTTTNNIWVYYDNPVSPVDAVTKLQNVYIENICVDSETPLRLFFAPTDDQKDLKFSRPKQPPDNKGECYYWRTTNCFSKDQCPLLHLPANKNIDAQIWMRLLKENPEKESDDNETSSANNQLNADNSTESASEL